MNAMTLPLSYNLRNLTVRKTTTVMTGLGIALSVAILVASLALVNGLRTLFANSAHPLNLLVLRKGAPAELVSSIPTDTLGVLSVKAGVATGRDGHPLVSPEVVNVANIPSIDHPQGMNVTVRGLTAIGFELRNVRLVDGRWFQAGLNEVVVGKSVTQRYPSARLGRQIRVGKSDWTVVGVMDGGDSALNSEIWGDLNRISADYNRQDSANAVLMRAEDSVALDALAHTFENDGRLNVSAMTERAYYDSQIVSGAPLEFLGILVAVMMAIGSGFATTNTMYAAVARRGKEIGTLRTLGFSEGSVLLSFLLEAVLLSAIAGALGCVLALPLNWLTTGVTSVASFSEVAFRFRVGVGALISGLVFAVVLGAFGGILPARAAAKKEILAALREL
jgi:ABC-type antimicrobial peptide transport system permease subunit